MNNKIILSLVVISIAAMWLVSYIFLSILSVGPDPTHEFSKNYRMIRGTLYYLPEPKDYNSIEDAFPERVERFCVIENWLLGETEAGYFAIDMIEDEMFYPLPSMQEIVDKANISSPSVDWLDPYDSSDYLLRNPGVLRLWSIMNYIFVISLFFCFAIFSIGNQGKRD